jgi:hypothetical protein
VNKVLRPQCRTHQPPTRFLPVTQSGHLTPGGRFRSSDSYPATTFQALILTSSAWAQECYPVSMDLYHSLKPGDAVATGVAVHRS